MYVHQAHAGAVHLPKIPALGNRPQHWLDGGYYCAGENIHPIIK
jgi:hypothetical protein